ncbi:hypothetical protein ACQJBY_019314 [Aegilops geniculata]
MPSPHHPSFPFFHIGAVERRTTCRRRPFGLTESGRLTRGDGGAARGATSRAAAGGHFEGRRRGPAGERRGRGVGPPLDGALGAWSPASSAARTLKGVIRRTRSCASASSAPARGAFPANAVERRASCRGLLPRGRRFGLPAIGGPRRLHLAARCDGERVDGRGGAVCRVTASAVAEAPFEGAAAWTGRRARRTGRGPSSP